MGYMPSGIKNEQPTAIFKRGDIVDVQWPNKTRYAYNAVIADKPTWHDDIATYIYEINVGGEICSAFEYCIRLAEHHDIGEHLSQPLEPKNPVLTASQLRKMLPVGTVVTKYFPKGMRGVAAVAWVGNEKHNPGEPLGWSENKSSDHVDCAVRHLQDAVDGDGWDTTELPDGRVYQVRHAAQAAWRALALAELDARSTGGEVVRRIK